MGLWSRLRRRTYWTTGLYHTDRADLPLAGRLIRTFGANRSLRLPFAQHTQADPFLLVRGGRLYLFLEVVRADRAGVIDAWSSADLVDWTPHGTGLAAATHLSYPNVFEIAGETYMVPESKAAGGVTLYRFAAFPRDLRPVRQLLSGAYNDPTPFAHDGHWYLFATSAAGLELHVSDDILTAPFRRHPIGVIERDIRHARCGGPIVARGGLLFRPAQDDRTRYGGSLDLREITTLTPTDYAERPAHSAVLPRNRSWNRAGGHHLSIVEFDGAIVFATDGQGWDPYQHKLTVRIGMLLDLLRGWTSGLIGARRHSGKAVRLD